MNWKDFVIDVLVIIAGFVLGKLLAVYVVKPLGIPIYAGDRAPEILQAIGGAAPVTTAARFVTPTTVGGV